MKFILFAVLVTISTVSLFAQKVKEKDNIYYVDGVVYMYGDFNYNYNETATFASADKKVTYFVINVIKAYRSNMNGSQPYKYVKLLFNQDSKFLFSTHSITHIVKELYLCKCVGADGTIDYQKLIKSSKAFTPDPPGY